MPIYCYETKDGDVFEEIFPMGEAPEFIMVGRKKAKRCLRAESKSKGNTARPGWPIECYASGVNAAQANELRAHFRKHNFDCEVSENGNPIYRDSVHREKALKLRGFRDKASFNR